MSLVMEPGGQSSQGLNLVGSHLNGNVLSFGGKSKPPIYAEEWFDDLCSLGGVKKS